VRDSDFCTACGGEPHDPHEGCSGCHEWNEGVGEEARDVGALGRDTLPPAATADTLPPPGELPSPRAALMSREPLPDVTLATLLRLLKHAAKPGCGFEITQYPGHGSGPYFAVNLLTGVGGDQFSSTGYGGAEQAALDAFAELASKLEERLGVLPFPGGLVDATQFRADNAPTSTTLTEEVPW
jgi:hypothetical protein